MREKITHLYKKSFVDVIKYGGSKHIIELPSRINRILYLSFFISNSIKDSTNIRTLTFPAVETSIVLFSNNQTISNLLLLNNPFADINGNVNVSLNSIKIPVMKKNVLNTKSIIIFKKNKALEIAEKDAETGTLFKNWKPKIEMILEYD